MTISSNIRRAHKPAILAEQIVLFSFSGTAVSLGTTAKIYPNVSDVPFTTSSTGGETIAVTCTLANGQTVTPKVYVLSTGLPATASALPSGSYYIKQRELGNIMTITYTKSAGVQAGSVSGCAIKESYNP